MGQEKKEYNVSLSDWINYFEWIVEGYENTFGSGLNTVFQIAAIIIALFSFSAATYSLAAIFAQSGIELNISPVVNTIMALSIILAFFSVFFIGYAYHKKISKKSRYVKAKTLLDQIMRGDISDPRIIREKWYRNLIIKNERKDVKMKNQKSSININKDDYYREVHTRERLVGIFLIISGFILAYSKELIKELLVLIFIMYIIFTLFYYIFLTRTKDQYGTDFFGFLSSYAFSMFLLLFVFSYITDSILPLDILFLFLFILLTGTFTFALLSPLTSEKLIKITDNFSINFKNNHPNFSKFLKWITIIGFICLMIYLYYWGYYLQ